eukprot:Lithocolla_globosa_v1_NODE_493_length_3897_cov_316.316502.p5 type:complete len:102 gc:universal NODE_493_length_3897_cov_316.316502:2106-2411(+)
MHTTPSTVPDRASELGCSNHYTWSDIPRSPDSHFDHGQASSSSCYTRCGFSGRHIVVAYISDKMEWAFPLSFRALVNIFRHASAISNGCQWRDRSRCDLGE